MHTLIWVLTEQEAFKQKLRILKTVSNYLSKPGLLLGQPTKWSVPWRAVKKAKLLRATSPLNLLHLTVSLRPRQEVSDWRIVWLPVTSLRHLDKVSTIVYINSWRYSSITDWKKGFLLVVNTLIWNGKRNLLLFSNVYQSNLLNNNPNCKIISLFLN